MTLSWQWMEQQTAVIACSLCARSMRAKRREKEEDVFSTPRNEAGRNMEWEDKYLLSWSEIYSIWDFLVFHKTEKPSTSSMFNASSLSSQSSQGISHSNNNNKQQPKQRVNTTAKTNSQSVFGKKFLINSRSFSFSILALTTINPSNSSSSSTSKKSQSGWVEG